MVGEDVSFYIRTFLLIAWKQQGAYETEISVTCEDLSPMMLHVFILEGEGSLAEFPIVSKLVTFNPQLSVVRNQAWHA